MTYRYTRSEQGVLIGYFFLEPVSVGEKADRENRRRVQADSLHSRAGTRSPSEAGRRRDRVDLFECTGHVDEMLSYWT